MSNITVFVFLLESVPGFENSLKSTLQSISRKYNSNIFSKCDPYAAELIWNHVNKSRNLINEINFFPNKYRSKVLNDNFISSEIYDNSLENNDIENDLIDNHENNNFQKLSKNIYKTTNFEFPKNAPFLVAIFETITNITAQTCGGTLISPQWVLTAASCLNLLPSFYKNLTKQNKFHKSYYTIIANAKNPLIDGTVHNVTKVILHPKYKLGIKKNLIKTNNESQIALMRIEPAANIHGIHIFKRKIKLGTGVRVYGWTLQKNSTEDSTREYIGTTSIPAKIINSNKCKSNFNSLNENSLLCLSADNESRVKISQMSSGGPVLVYSEGIIKILAVAQIDTSSRIIAYALNNND